VPIDNLQRFYKKFYQPDNIVFIVAGKFEEKKALDYISEYFGALKRPERKLDNTYTEEPAQDGERNVTLRRVGKVAMAGTLYHIPAAAHKDYAALDVLGTILGDDPSGRLYKALVETKKASAVSVNAYALHDPGIIETMAAVAGDVKPEEVRDIIIREMEEFGKKPATKDEVKRAVGRYMAERERTLADSRAVAMEL